MEEAIMKKLLSDMDSVCKIEYSQELKHIRDYHDKGFDFGDKKSNYRSLYNWIIYTRSLFVLNYLGYTNNGIILLKEFVRAKRRLDLIDFYNDGDDPKYMLSGIWCIVATFDKIERQQLLKALKKGKCIRKDEQLIKFFENSRFVNLQ